MRHQFVLDKKSNKLLNELAESRGGNRSRVVREALLYYADREAYLDQVESDPKFIEMMKKTAADIKAGRVYSQEEAERYVAAKRKRK
ncbi:MAG TPA: ribbon-helix-helix protein, CopG family [Verrucomicrobiae bacterium]|jgi:predicted transcriptional regulator|nr:ribbon-helix-helix protein, CopG family [Verrucomicrobiae bacterium]